MGQRDDCGVAEGIIDVGPWRLNQPDSELERVAARILDATRSLTHKLSLVQLP